MILVLSAFTVANIIAWAAQNYWELMAARILLAAAAGLYVPGANALAGAIAGPERRGTALAIVNGGITIAVAFGVPLGALVGDRLGWRMTFAGVAALSAAATAGLLFGLPRNIGAGLPTATLRERIHVARQPVILMTLLVTTLWAMGAYTIYTYLALFVARTTPLHGAEIGYVLFTWGVAAAIGVFIGGKAVDRLSPSRVIIPCLSVSILAFSLMSASALAAENLGTGSRPARRGGLGHGALVLLPRAASRADQPRWPARHAHCPVTQRFVHVSRLFARRRARFPDLEFHLGGQPWLDRRCVRSCGADPDSQHRQASGRGAKRSGHCRIRYRYRAADVCRSSQGAYRSFIGHIVKPGESASHALGVHDENAATETACFQPALSLSRRVVLPRSV
jgi:hypothetical protein